MSEENVEIARAAIDGYNQRDWNATLKDAAPGFELDNSRAAGPNRGVYGLDQVREALDEFADVWDSFRMEPHEFIEVGDHVVVPVTFHAVGRDGIEVQARPTWTVTIRGGAIERICMYQEREDALEALGVSG
jgi:ketosteroid isomerase-like protein